MDFFWNIGYIIFYSFSVAAFQSSIKLRSIFLSEWVSFGLSLILAYLVFFGLINLSGEDVILSNIAINFVLTLLDIQFLVFNCKHIFKNVNR